MAQAKKRMFDGPIPGANYTSDTRNYPWHRPPDLNSFDESVEYFLNKVSRPETMSFMASSMANGATIVELTTLSVLKMIKEGSVTPDMGILVAGPIAKTLEMIAEGQEIEYQRGWQQEPDLMTPERMKKEMEEPDEMEEIPFDIQKMDKNLEQELSTTGLMAEREADVAPVDEQQAMLGDTEEEVEETA
tara:strand:+ start:1817 stop:2383 length:567 start_codon:yes stop_codon:yes gene_type:complete